MLVDQKELDSVLAEANRLAADVAGEVVQPEPSLSSLPCAADRPQDGELSRILKVHVPIIVQLARRAMPIAAVRDFSLGAIIEFEKSVEEELDLLVNNRRIGRGLCVKVGENFGLRITQICDQAQRVRSLGA